MAAPVSYAVTWAAGDARFVGHALLADRGLRLEGREPNAQDGRRWIRFDQIVGVELRRSNGHRGLVVEIADEDECSSPASTGPAASGSSRIASGC